MTGLYIPEMLTPLYFTPLYADLAEDERLAYNRKHGLYFLEQTIFFEQITGRPVLEQLIRLSPDERISRGAQQFMDDENIHTSWFRALLREVEPEIYRRGDFHLLEVTPLMIHSTRLTARAVRWLPCLLWLQLIAEERSLYFGRCFMEAGEQLDRRFLSVQKRHMADETAHIGYDEVFIGWLWAESGENVRKINARLLEWLLREFFHLPKRSGWRVVESWLRDFPHLWARRDEFKAAMGNLSENENYLHTLYPRRYLPLTTELSAAWPELDFLQKFFTDEPI